MVARPGTYQASNNAGELAPEEYGRTDLKQFYSGLALARNIEPVPQGGSQLSMRTRHLGRIRRGVAAVALTTSTPPAGTYNAPGTVGSATFPQTSISVVSFGNLRASQALGAIMQVQYLAPDASYQPFGAPFTLGTDARTITVALQFDPDGSYARALSVRLRQGRDGTRLDRDAALNGRPRVPPHGRIRTARVIDPDRPVRCTTR